MMESNPQRVEQAWQAAKNWITVFDGTATEAHILNGKTHLLGQALGQLPAAVSRFRIAPILRDDLDPLDKDKDIPAGELIVLLERGDAVSLSANYQLDLDNTPLDIHLAIEPAGTAASQQLIDVIVVWWADQAFPDGVSPQSRFGTILDHLFWLAAQFQAERLFIGPEGLERPRDNPTHWTQV
jgi:hypothetical protein